MTSSPEGARQLEAWIENSLPQRLPEFLPRQRWFGGKAQAISAVHLEDAVWLPGTRAPCALVVAGIHYAAAAPERYDLLLGFFDQPGGLPAIDRVESSRSGIWVVEATTDPTAVLALLRGLASGEEVVGVRGGRLCYADATHAAMRALMPVAIDSATVVPVGAEQSNTSVRVGPAHVFKLFRRLDDDGENPELEIGRFLSTRTGFRAIPLLEGSLTYRSPGGPSSTLGVLESWVENRGDGWSHVVTTLQQVLGRAASLDEVVRDLFLLGTITADFHAALASDAAAPAFAPEPVTQADVDAWRGLLLERSARVFDLVERQRDGWPQKDRRLGAALLALRSRLDGLARPPKLGPRQAFRKIRVHGDYHLGQTLKTDEGFALIDFEGEPMKPLAERRQKQCALKDVAGMIRSFDYAVETVRQQLPPAGDARLLTLRLREAFVEGYSGRARAAGAAFLPTDARALAPWIDFFELEKAFYEVEYEVSNRPAWAYIPLRGAIRILRGERS